MVNNLITKVGFKANQTAEVHAQLVDAKHEDALNTAQEALRAAQETEDRRGSRRVEVVFSTPGTDGTGQKSWKMWIF